MATYLIVNVVFLLIVMLMLRVKPVLPSRAAMITLAMLLVLTAIFDSMIIAFDIVGYDQAQILGIYIGRAPIEDFFYALMAAIVVPTLWNSLGRRS